MKKLTLVEKHFKSTCKRCQAEWYGAPGYCGICHHFPPRIKCKKCTFETDDPMAATRHLETCPNKL